MVKLVVVNWGNEKMLTQHISEIISCCKSATRIGLGPGAEESFADLAKF